MKNNKKIQKGISLIESLIAIAVISTLVFVFLATANNIYLNTSAKNRSLAYQLAQEEIEALKKIPFLSLTDKNPGDNAPFIEVAYNYGDWKVINDGGNNVYSIAATGSRPSLVLLPNDNYADFTLEVKIKILPTSPAGWEAGYYFRYHDKNNYYLLKFNSSKITLEKKFNGNPPQVLKEMNSTPAAIGDIYKLIASGNNFDLWKNSNHLTTIPVIDTENIFSSGKIALFGSNSVQSYFDDIKVSLPAIDENFNSGPIGEVAQGWQRTSLYDLPSASDLLTIQNYESSSDIKEVTAKIEWQEKNRSKSVSLTTLISKYGVGK